MKIETKQSILITKILDFIKQQKVKGIKILTTKQMLQRSSIVISQKKLDKSYILYIGKEKFLKKYITVQ